MRTHLLLLSAVLPLVIAGGCNKAEKEGNITGPAALKICFIDPEGRDLVEGVPATTWASSPAEYDSFKDPDEPVCMIRCEIVCPYIFGDDQARTLTGEFSLGTGGYHWFQRCWFEGAELPPLYAAEGWRVQSFYIARTGS